MATEVLMPRQGQSVESCLIVEWKKNEGDSVSEGEILCEVETDKATFEVEAPASGVLLRILHQAEDDVPVLTPIAYIGEAGEEIEHEGTDDAAEDLPEEHQQERAQSQDRRTPGADTPTDRQPQQAGSDTGGSGFISPRARKLAAKHGLDYHALTGSGPGGRIIERDIQAQLESGEPLTAAARAETAGTAVPSHGSGIGGRVRTAALQQPASTTAALDAGAPGADFPGPSEAQPLKGVRKVIAQRMLASLQTTAQLTLDSSADARALQRLRRRFKETDAALGLGGVTINDLLHYAVSRTLQRFGYMNSHMGDSEIRQFRHVHLGFAVDTPKGLMVPTIRFSDRLSLLQLSEEARRLAAACQQGSAEADELVHGTFTVTNLGGLGIERFTPVLNPPQVAILGVSNIQLKPVAGESEVEFVPSIGLSLTIDHRAVDGAPAARFLQALCEAIAAIDLTLAL